MNNPSRMNNPSSDSALPETQAQRDELERTLDESGQYQELADVQKEPLGQLDPNAETLEAHGEAFAEAARTGQPIGG